MRPKLEDGRLQVIAAASLLDNSQLVKWIPDSKQFEAVTFEAFKMIRDKRRPDLLPTMLAKETQ